MSNSGVVFRWLPSNQTEIKNHRKNYGRTPNLQSHINKMHLNYIATRPGAVFNQNAHGIFGYIYNQEENKLMNCDDLKLEKISDRVGEMSKRGIDVFKTVISLKEEDAISYGYIDRASWKGLIELKINKIAKEFRIPVRDLEWTASYHTEKGHLHCHLLFWDRNQNDENKKNNRMPFVRYKDIRKELSKEIFKRDYLLAIEDKNKSKEEMIQFSEEEIENWLYEVMPEDMPVRKVFNHRINKIDNLTNKIRGLEDFIKQENLKSIKTDKISYKYGFQSKKVKEYIDNISMQIINSSSDCKKLFSNYLKNCIEVQRVIGAIENKSEEDKIKEIVEKELFNKMGNIILKDLKNINIEKNRKIKKAREEEYKERYEKFMDQKLENQIIKNNLYINNFTTLNTVEQIFRKLSMLNYSNKIKLSRIKKEYNNLSKEEKNAIAKMKENSNGFEWFDD